MINLIDFQGFYTIFFQTFDIFQRYYYNDMNTKNKISSFF